jgi:hypothetical protein
LAVTRRAHTLSVMNSDSADLSGEPYGRLWDGRSVIFHNADVPMRPAIAWRGGMCLGITYDLCVSVVFCTIAYSYAFQ